MAYIVEGSALYERFLVIIIFSGGVCNDAVILNRDAKTGYEFCGFDEVTETTRFFISGNSWNLYFYSNWDTPGWFTVTYDRLGKYIIFWSVCRL